MCVCGGGGGGGGEKERVKWESCPLLDLKGHFTLLESLTELE